MFPKDTKELERIQINHLNNYLTDEGGLVLVGQLGEIPAGVSQYQGGLLAAGYRTVFSAYAHGVGAIYCNGVEGLVGREAWLGVRRILMQP